MALGQLSAACLTFCDNLANLIISQKFPSILLHFKNLDGSLDLSIFLFKPVRAWLLPVTPPMETGRWSSAGPRPIACCSSWQVNNTHTKLTANILLCWLPIILSFKTQSKEIYRKLANYTYTYTGWPPKKGPLCYIASNFRNTA